MCMCVCVCVRVGGWGWKKEWLSNLGNLIQNATHERSELNRSKRQNWVEIIHGISIQTTFITLIKCVKIEKNLQHKPLPLIQKLPPSLVSVLRESWVISGVIWSIDCFGGQPLSIYVKLSKYRMMLRWFRKQTGKNEMTAIRNNILSDPTSDGNFSTTDNNGQTERPSSPVYSYEEFGCSRVNHVSSDQSLTQTCPTCGGTGKLTKGKRSFLNTGFN